MFTATVLRRQYAVGHGGFHSGRIAVRKDDGQFPGLMLFESKDAAGATTTILEKFYVYDCGSECTIAGRSRLSRLTALCEIIAS
jgi:hypothetical protein